MDSGDIERERGITILVKYIHTFDPYRIFKIFPASRLKMFVRHVV